LLSDAYRAIAQPDQYNHVRIQFATKYNNKSYSEISPKNHYAFLILLQSYDPSDNININCHLDDGVPGDSLAPVIDRTGEGWEAPPPIDFLSSLFQVTTLLKDAGGFPSLIGSTVNRGQAVSGDDIAKMVVDTACRSGRAGVGTLRFEKDGTVLVSYF